MTDTGPALPTPAEVLADPSTSDWLKNALKAAMHRDVVDAVNDAEFLALLLAKRCQNALS